MKKVFQQRPLAVYFFIAFVLGLAATAYRHVQPSNVLLPVLQEMQDNAVPANVFTGVFYTVKYPELWTYLAFPLTPTIAALIVIAFGFGKAGFNDLGGRLKLWRGVDWRTGAFTWLVVFTAFYAVAGLLFIGTAIHQPAGTIDTLTAPFGGPSIALIYMYLPLALLLSVGPLFEEIGWRAFALPILLQKMTPLAASLVLAVMWEAWHIPRDLPALFSGDPGAVAHFVGRQIGLFLGFAAGCILTTYLFLRLGGVVWAGVLIHAIHNETAVGFGVGWNPVLFSIFSEGYTVAECIRIVAALAILGFLGPDLGFKRNPALAEKAKYSISAN